MPAGDFTRPFAPPFQPLPADPADGGSQAGRLGNAAVAPVEFLAAVQIASMVAPCLSRVATSALSLACALALAAGAVSLSTVSMSVWTVVESNDQLMTSLSAVSRLNEASDSVTW